MDLHEIHKIEYNNREHGQVHLIEYYTKFLTETDLNSHVVIFIARCDWHENIDKFNSVAPQSGHRYNRYDNKRNPK